MEGNFAEGSGYHKGSRHKRMDISGGEVEDKFTGPDLVRALATRFRGIIQAKNEGKEPPENPLIPGQKDSEAEVRADACILMGKARLTPPPPLTTPKTPTSSSATEMKLKPTKYTQGLTVRPHEVQNKYLLPKPKSYTQNKVMGGDDASSSEDEEEEERKQSKRKRKPLKPELLLSIPSAAGE